MLDGTIMYHSRVVVPVCLQEEGLEGLHAAPKGIEGMQSKARETACVLAQHHQGPGPGAANAM